MRYRVTRFNSVTCSAVALVACCCLTLSSIQAADAPSENPSPLNLTIDRGLAFLAKDALAWKAEHNCASCHHAALVVWAMEEARQRGHSVDQAVLADMTQWIANAGDGTTGSPRPEAIPRAFNEKAVSFSLGLLAIKQPDEMVQAGLARMLATIKKDQIENGKWASWTNTRPPIFGYSDERATASAALTLLAPAAAGDEAAQAARDKAVQWLVETPTDDQAQSVALRLVLWQRLGRPADEIERLAARIRERQNDDGGWSQIREMPSDAWATGQALYALAHAGLSASDPAIRRGQEFLIKSQRENGSWPMTSRPTEPVGEGGSTSLIPITGAGSAWAVLGLVRSAAP